MECSLGLSPEWPDLGTQYARNRFSVRDWLEKPKQRFLNADGAESSHFPIFDLPQRSLQRLDSPSLLLCAAVFPCGQPHFSGDNGLRRF
ncbi:hypothetical protein SH661x_001614 [Planctomicrobium sp. SH661]|uniref:hypothetical protein n=1 Tax=Planctomicrobium sp. SH661 TaxID=3448124 RepID=UPI003F5B42AC